MDYLWLLPIITAALSFIGGLAGAYFRAYSTKKGENLATKEDIGKLTTITKKIESEISDAAWNRQRRWELKRDVLFEAIKRLAEIEEAIVGLQASLKAILQASKNRGTLDDPVGFGEKIDEWNHAAAGFDDAHLKIAIVCGKETEEAFFKCKLVANDIAMGILNNKDAEIFVKSNKQLEVRRSAAKAAVRKRTWNLVVLASQLGLFSASSSSASGSVLAQQTGGALSPKMSLRRNDRMMQGMPRFEFPVPSAATQAQLRRGRGASRGSLEGAPAKACFPDCCAQF
jgi:hypothetical protein